MLQNSKLLVLIFLISFLIKFAGLAYTDGFEREPIEDALDYHNHAMAIYYGQGFGNNGAKPDEQLVETSSRPPALPYALASVYDISKPEPWVGRVFIILVGSLTTTIVFILSLEIFKSRKLSILASTLFLLYPPANYFSLFLLTETLASFFCIVSTYFFFVAMKENKLSSFLLFGISCGFLVLTRSQFLLLMPFLLISSLLLNYFLDIKNKISLKNSCLSVLAFILILTPWTLRNYEVHDSFMPTTSRLGYMIYLSNHDLDDPEIQKGGYSRSAFLNSEYVNSYPESEKSGVYIKEVLQEIQENPLQIIRPLIMRTINHLSYRPNPYKQYYGTSDFIMFLVWIPILIMFLFSLRQSSHERNWILYAVIFYNFVVCLPFWGTPRLRFPVDSLFIICTCLALLSFKFKTIKKYV